MNGDTEIKDAVKAMPLLAKLSLNSNRNTSELEFTLTHSKKTIAPLSNRNFSRVLSSDPFRGAQVASRVTRHESLFLAYHPGARQKGSDKHGTHAGDAD